MLQKNREKAERKAKRSPVMPAPKIEKSFQEKKRKLQKKLDKQAEM